MLKVDMGRKIFQRILRLRSRAYKLGRLSAARSFWQRHTATNRQRAIASAMAVVIVAGIAIPIIADQRHAAAWWNSSWGYRRQISVDNSASGSTLTDFPIRVSITSSDINYANTLSGGNDVRFVDGDDNTPLDYQIESWNPGGTSEVWVRIPSLTNSATYKIYMYYGNPSASNGQNSTGVWDANFKGVWHMNETGNGTAGEFKDSTSNGNNGQGGGGTGSKVPSSGSAIIGNGLNFNRASGQYFSVPASNTFNSITGNITQSIWVKSTTANVYEGLMVNAIAAATTTNYEMMICDTSCTGTANRYFTYSDTPSPIGINSTTPTDTVNWHNVVFTRSGTTAKIYIDGVQDVSTSMTGSFTGNSSCLLFFGIEGTNAATALNGSMDESRLSNTGRSADWIMAEYLTDTDSMNTFGSEETPVPPDAPMLTPLTMSTSTTPTFQMVATDQVDPTYLRYKVDVCATSDCSSIVRTIDQTSSQTGWSGQDAQAGTAYKASDTIGGGGYATPQYVQSNSFTPSNPLTPISTNSSSFTSDVGADNLIVAYARWDTTTTTTLVGCSDTLGNTYTIAQQQNNTTDKQAHGSCYAINTNGNGPNTVTMTLSNAVIYTGMLIGEYSGVSTTAPLDVKSQAYSTSTSTSPNSGSATTTQDNDLIVGFFLNNDTYNAGDSAGAGYVQRQSTNVSQMYLQDKVLPVAGSVAANMSFVTASRYGASMLAFKPALLAGSSTATYTYQAPALAAGTQYWWRAYAIDPSGSNTYSAASQISTFATAGPPASPTLISPVSGTVSASAPEFRLYTTDVNSDYVKYKIDVCSTSNCSSVVRTIDQSASQTGWQSQSVQGVTAYRAGPQLSNSDQAVYLYQSPGLSPGTQYWWRAYAIDPGGSNTLSPASVIATFTTTTGNAGERITGGTKITGGSRIGN